jgi:hypothetical protein
MGGMRRITAVGVLAAVLLLGGCSGDGDDEATGTDTSTETADATDDSTPTADVVQDEADSGGETAGDLDAFCDAFPELGGDAQDQALTAEQWELRIANVEQIAATAPDEISAQADAYVEMTEARAELAAENGYVAANDLPAEARQAFIATARELQAQVNELIAYAQEACGGIGQG